VSAALRQAEQYSVSVRCTAAAALPQILAAHNDTTRVMIEYRQPLPPAHSLHRSSIYAPISQICSHDLIFGFQISTAYRVSVQQLASLPSTCAYTRQNEPLCNS
jgi:hypothetical protein